MKTRNAGRACKKREFAQFDASGSTRNKEKRNLVAIKMNLRTPEGRGEERVYVIPDLSYCWEEAKE